MLKDLPHEYTDSLGKHSCRNLESLQKEAYPDHDEKMCIPTYKKRSREKPMMYTIQIRM